MVRSGKPLSVALKGRNISCHFCHRWQRQGSSLVKLMRCWGGRRRFYEDELDERIAAISTMIEPILMVIMALMAGFIVMAILFLIYSLVSKVSA